MEEEGCLQRDVFTWVWDATGEWGWIVPKTMPNKVIDLSNKKALLWSKHFGNNQKFKFDGKLLISKAYPDHAMASTADGVLYAAVPIVDRPESQFWTLEKGGTFLQELC